MVYFKHLSTYEDLEKCIIVHEKKYQSILLYPYIPNIQAAIYRSVVKFIRVLYVVAINSLNFSIYKFVVVFCP